jgi:hypothetical protein
VLAVKEWRARFTVSAADLAITVDSVRSGYRPRELETGAGAELALHRAFVARFG